MRKIFLEDLPKLKGSECQINWKKSVGYNVRFVYDDIEGEVTILNYFKKNNKVPHIKLKYKDNETSMYTGSFANCSLGNLLSKKTSSYIYDVSDIVHNLKSGKLKILKCIRTSGNKNHKGYDYECLTCGNLDTIDEYNLKRKGGCNVCSNRKVQIGYNDIHTINSKFGELFWDYNDGYNYTCNSNEKSDFKCLNCGNRIINKRINTTYNQGLSCSQCSDGVSYPNKLIYNTLKQINIIFETEYSPNWAFVTGNKNEKLNGMKKYDIFIPSMYCVVEMHGGFHFKDRNKYKNGKSLCEEQENDRLKEKLAKENGIAHYLTIKSDISELEYIKHNILNSDLTKIIDFSNIDWGKVDADSQKSFVKSTCDYYNNGNYTTTQIGELMNLSSSTVIKYLKQGSKIGWCNYNPNEEMRKNGKRRGKPIVRLSLKGEYIDEYESGWEVERQLKINPSKISEVCRGKYGRKSAGGFRWMYKEDYEKHIEEVKGELK